MNLAKWKPIPSVRVWSLASSVFGHWLVPTKRRMMTVESGLTSGVWRQFT